MLGLYPRILAVTIAAALSLGTGACLCPAVAAASTASTPTAAPEKSGCSRCVQKRQQSAPQTPAKKPSCPECRMTVRPDRAVEKTVPHLPAMVAVALPMVVVDAVPASIGREMPRPDASPPILLDLFHSSCLLTI
jgi:hypothetical protein